MRLVLFMALTLLVPASAEAVDLRFPDGRVAQPYTRWARQSKAPVPVGRFTVVTGDCPAYPPGSVEGCAALESSTIWLGMRERRNPSAFFHELGHFFDERAMTAEARSTFAAILDQSWNVELFAEAYETCATLDTRVAVAVMPSPFYPYKTTLARHKRVCSLIRRQAERQTP